MSARILRREARRLTVASLLETLNVKTSVWVVTALGAPTFDLYTVYALVGH